jgi:hypothetical protein
LKPSVPEWRLWLRRLSPYVVAASVVAAILRKYPVTEIVTEMRLGHARWVFPLALALELVVWPAYAAYDRVVLVNAIGPIRYGDVLRAKAATAVLLTLGYLFGGGGYVLWIVRKTGTRTVRAAGAVLYVMASDLVAVCAIAGVSMWFGRIEVPHVLRTIATAIFGVQVLLILAGPYAARGRPIPLFDPWSRVPRSWGLAQIGGRAANIAAICAFTWAAARAFGIDLPLGAMGMYMPIILLVSSLPFSVAGFGAAQAAWLLLLPWASGPRILAFQTLWQLSTGAGFILRGLPFIRRVVAEIDAGSPVPDEGG